MILADIVGYFLFTLSLKVFDAILSFKSLVENNLFVKSNLYNQMVVANLLTLDLKKKKKFKMTFLNEFWVLIH